MPRTCFHASRRARLPLLSTLLVALVVLSPAAALGRQGASAHTYATVAASSLLIGDQTIESTAGYTPAGQAKAFSFYGANGTAQSISVYVDSHTTSTTLVAGIYRANPGLNGAPLIASGSLSTLTKNAWNTIAIPSMSVSSSNVYWVSVLGTGGTLYFRDRSPGLCTAFSSSQTALTSLPSSFSQGASQSACPASVYVSGSTSRPANTALPAVTGMTTQGQTLATTNGSWSNGPTAYSIQWQDCDTIGANCSNITGATASSYTLTSADTGHAIRSQVTASNTSGSTTASSAQTKTVASQPPGNTALPTVTGMTTQGQTLATTNGSWSNGPTRYSSQWQDCDSVGASCSNITGATASSYTLTSADTGHAIRSQVTASNTGGSTTASSAPTSTVGAPSGGLPGNPENTSANVHVGLPALTSISNCCNSLLSSNPPVGEVWNYNPPGGGSPASYPSIYKGIYMPGDAQPDTRYAPNNTGTQSLSWFETNHPDWLELKCSASSVSGSTATQRATNAVNAGYLAVYASGAGNDYPLDTSNPAVMSWLESNIWGPILSTGDWQHLDMDNFVTTQGSWTGPHCGHFNSSGTWVGQYNGTTDDPAWRTHEINYASELASWVHTTYPNVALACNLTWSDFFTSDEESILRPCDLWFDEQGFTNGNNSPGEFNNAAWQDKAAAVSAVVNAGHGWEDINQEPVSFASTTQAQRQWALGNYLLFKNSASWIFISGVQEYGSLLTAPEYSAAQVGTPTGTYYADQGVYRRDFTQGLVLVNPSSSTSFTVTLPANSYKDLSGNTQASSIALRAGSAIVLVHL